MSDLNPKSEAEGSGGSGQSNKKKPTPKEVIVVILGVAIIGIIVISTIVRLIGQLRPAFDGDTGVYAGVAGLSKDQNGKISGKIMVVDEDTGEIHPLYDALPEELRARTPEDVETVIQVHVERDYKFDLTSMTYDALTKTEVPVKPLEYIPAYAPKWHLTVINYKDRKVIADRLFIGDEPPSNVSFNTSFNGKLGVSIPIVDLSGNYTFQQTNCTVLLGSEGGILRKDGRRIVGVDGPMDVKAITEWINSLEVSRTVWDQLNVPGVLVLLAVILEMILIYSSRDKKGQKTAS